MRRRYVFCMMATAALVAVGQLALAMTAGASVGTDCSTPQSGLCEYWGQSYDGSHSRIYNVTEVANLPVSGSTPYVFLSSGSGNGEYLGNNNGSVRNYNDVSVNLYYNTNFSGPELTLSQYNTSGYQKAGSAQGSLLNNLRSFTLGIP